MHLTARRTSSRPTRSLAPRPRLGILASHPIQYQAPLYRELSRRGVIELDVAFLSNQGAQPYRDPGFGVTVHWNVNLLTGYHWRLLERRALPGKAAWLRATANWLRQQDVVVLHGHADPDILAAMTACRLLRVPYLLRGDSHPDPAAIGWRRAARHAVAYFAVGGAAGALPIGELNAAFYRRYARIPLYPAPYSVDNDRFRAASAAASAARPERLSSLGLDSHRPTIIFCGKLTAQKRPMDAVRAIARCADRFNLVLIGDGPLRGEIRRHEARLPVRCTGFVNQAELPAWYACGDILVMPSEGREAWGLVVNEGMASGLVPVVSSEVGCATDLVRGIGEIFPVGDIDALARALIRAADEAPARRARIPGRLAKYSLAETAAGFERAALSLSGHGAPS